MATNFQVIKMAYPNVIQRIVQMGKVIRDWKLPLNTSDTSFTLDTVQEYKAVGLDFMIVNNGTTTVNIEIDGFEDTIDVEGGDSFSFSDIAYTMIKITNSGGATLIGFFAGKKIERFG